MRKFLLFSIVVLLSSLIFLLFSALVFSLDAREGFYKEVFVDEGTGLSGPSRIPAIAYIGGEHEWMEIDSNNALQNSIMISNSDDANGALLYPDGEPRFAIVYSHGGYTRHSKELGEEGRARVRAHYYHGGSHVGSCAGSYIQSSGSSNYYRLWPGRVGSPNVSNFRLDGTIPDDSPLLKYYDFGGDKYIERIYHNNGGCVREPAPEGTEILLRHANVTANPDMNGKGAVWAWKENDTTGRAIGITSHPEGSGSGELRDYMAGCLRYALDGLAPPDIKHQFVNGTKIAMDKETADNNPAYTKIGDLQYHHFTVDLTSASAKNLEVTLEGEAGYDMHLFVTKDTFALSGSAEYSETGVGNMKSIKIPTVPAGTWHVGVKCATTVTSTKISSGDDSYYAYSGKVNVLNGVQYAITAKWESTNILTKKAQLLASQLTMRYNGKIVSIAVRNNVTPDLKIFNIQGRLCWENSGNRNSKQYSWRPQSAGMYILHMSTGTERITKRITIAK